MKRLMIAAILGMVCATAWAESWQVTVTTTSAIVAPDLNFSPTNAWATGSISAGAYVTNSTGRAYWTPNGGTATSGQEPTHRRGIATGTDSIQWLAMRNHRSNIVVQNTDASSNDIWVERSTASAVSNTCYLLSVRGMAWDFPGYSGELNAQTGSSTATLVVIEEE